MPDEKRKTDAANLLAIYKQAKVDAEGVKVGDAIVGVIPSSGVRDYNSAEYSVYFNTYQQNLPKIWANAQKVVEVGSRQTCPYMSCDTISEIQENSKAVLANLLEACKPFLALLDSLEIQKDSLTEVSISSAMLYSLRDAVIAAKKS